MLLTDLVIRKVDKSDPRYPDDSPRVALYTDVYLCSIKLDDGTELECPFGTAAMTLAQAELMLTIFAASIKRVATKQAA